MGQIIGRTQEIRDLERLYHSPRAEFIAVYGRRRVGKTYLIREALNGRITFSHTGLAPYDEGGKASGNEMTEQLLNFYTSLVRYGHKGTHLPKNWIEAFFMLEQLLESESQGKRIVVFLDELPWMDTPRSSFLRAFEGFWNSYASSKANMMLIVCGSATSWMEKNIGTNKKGLYRRLTHEIRLKPFTLHECEAFYRYMGVDMNRFDIVESYMTFGGIPYYMGYLTPGKSLAQNIDTMFFAEYASLRNEFGLLFGSLFKRPEPYVKIIRFLATRHGGYTREEIMKGTGIPSGQTLTTMLYSLEASCFIKKYQAFMGTKRDMYYRLTDLFCWFYIKIMDKELPTDPNYWQHSMNLPRLNSWRGLAFEEVCLSHVQQMKSALGVGNVLSTESVWSLQGTDEQRGTQIDLVVRRNDHVVNLFEMKYWAREFAVDKDYYMKLRNRIGIVAERINKRDNIQLTLVTTFGLAYNKYSNIIQNTLTIDDLFS